MSNHGPFNQHILVGMISISHDGFDHKLSFLEITTKQGFWI